MHLSLKRYQRHLLVVVVVVLLLLLLLVYVSWAAFFISACSIDKRQAAKFQTVVVPTKVSRYTKRNVKDTFQQSGEEEEGGRTGVEGLLQFNYPKAATEHSLRTLTVPYRTAPHRNTA